MLKKNTHLTSTTLLFLLLQLSLASMAAGLKPGMDAPGFDLKSLQGKQVTLRSLQDKGHVMLVFWEPECIFCYMHIHEFNALHTKYDNKGLSIAAINFRGEYEAEIEDYVEENKLKYLMLTDQLKNIAVADSYKVFASPTIVLISPEGKIIYYGHNIPDINKWLQ